MKKLILLCYVNRSGSTYLSQILSTDKHMCVCPEGEGLVPLLLEDPAAEPALSGAQLQDAFNTDPKLKHWHLDLDPLEETSHFGSNFALFRGLLDLYREQHQPGATCVLFKAERLIHLVAKLTGLSERDRLLVISLVRDGRAVYHSQKRTVVPETGQQMTSDIIQTALFWRSHIRKSLRLKKENRVLQLRYEDLISHMDETISAIGGQLEEDLRTGHPAQGDLFQRLPEAHQPIHRHIRSGPVLKRLDAWKQELDAREKQIFTYLCRKELKALGYMIEDSQISNVIKCRLHWKALISGLHSLRTRIRFHLR